MVSLTAWGRGGKLAVVWGAVYWDVQEEEDDFWSDAFAIAGGLLTTSFMIAPGITYGATGVVTKAIVTNPVVQIITGAVVAGAIVSNEIDPDSGFDNYIGFISGGEFGEPDINYWDTDPNDSGYFNVGKNLEIIYEHWKKSKVDHISMKRPGRKATPDFRGRPGQVW